MTAAEKPLSEPCRICINWINDSECVIGMPQEACPSRRDLEIFQKHAVELEAEVKRFTDKYEPKCKCLTCGKMENACADHALWVEDCPSYIDKLTYITEHEEDTFKNNLRLVKEVMDLKARLRLRCTRKICIVGKCPFKPEDRCFKVDETPKDTTLTDKLYESCCQELYDTCEEVINLQARLAKAQELADKLCDSQPDPYDDAYSDSAPWIIMRRQIGRELKKALGVSSVGETGK